MVRVKLGGNTDGSALFSEESPRGLVEGDVQSGEGGHFLDAAQFFKGS